MRQGWTKTRPTWLATRYPHKILAKKTILAFVGGQIVPWRCAFLRRARAWLPCRKDLLRSAMPQMQLCGRYTAFASDDFVTTGSCNAAWRLLSGLTLVVVVVLQGLSESHSGTAHCTATVSAVLYTALAVMLLGVFVDTALSCNSARGTLGDPAPRRLVPGLFVTHLISAGLLTCLAIGGAVAVSDPLYPLLHCPLTALLLSAAAHASSPPLHSCSQPRQALVLPCWDVGILSGCCCRCFAGSLPCTCWASGWYCCPSCAWQAPAALHSRECRG